MNNKKNNNKLVNLLLLCLSLTITSCNPTSNKSFSFSSIAREFENLNTQSLFIDSSVKKSLNDYLSNYQVLSETDNPETLNYLSNVNEKVLNKILESLETNLYKSFSTIKRYSDYLDVTSFKEYSFDFYMIDQDELKKFNDYFKYLNDNNEKFDVFSYVNDLLDKSINNTHDLFKEINDNYETLNKIPLEVNSFLNNQNYIDDRSLIDYLYEKYLIIPVNKFNENIILFKEIKDYFLKNFYTISAVTNILTFNVLDSQNKILGSINFDLLLENEYLDLLNNKTFNSSSIIIDYYDNCYKNLIGFDKIVIAYKLMLYHFDFNYLMYFLNLTLKLKNDMKINNCFLYQKNNIVNKNVFLSNINIENSVI